MKETAPLRTPVEIWTCILKLAIQNTVQCYDTANIAQDLYMFDMFNTHMECRSYHRHLASERVRTILRLVCQSWNLILKDAGDRFAVFYHGKPLPTADAYKTAHRIEVLSRHVWCHRGRCPLLMESTVVNRPVPKVSELSGNLEALVQEDEFTYNHEEFVRMKKLRLLSCSFTGRTENSLFLCVNTLQSLTHLHIKSLSFDTIQKLEISLCLPRLTMLSLDFNFICNRKTPPGGGSLARWILPKLDRLNLSGNTSKVLWKEIRKLLVACQSTITQIVLSTRTTWNLMREIFALLPHLTTWSVQSGQTLPITPDIQTKAYIFVLVHVHYLFSQNYAEEFLCIVKTFHIKKVVFVVSWRELIDTAKFSPMYGGDGIWKVREHLDAMEAVGVLVCDVDGCSLTQPRNEEFAAEVAVLSLQFTNEYGRKMVDEH